MKKIALAVALSMLGAGTSFAADLPVKALPMAAPLPVYDWTGFYVGGNVGGAWASSDRTSSADPIFWLPGNVILLNATAPATLRGTGAVGGLQAGYNWQRGAFVAGIEGDIDASSFRASHDTGILPGTGGAGLGTYQFVYTVKQDWLATIRGRAGWSVQNWLLYVTGGAAWTNIGQTGHAEFISGCGGGPACTTNASSSTTKAGWVAGAGVEYKVSRQWSVRAEYLHYDFGSTSANLPNLGSGGGVGVTAGSDFAQTINLKEDVVRVGANYKFDWGAAPVVAKY
jgi:outer membrane immunogenic protein